LAGEYLNYHVGAPPVLSSQEAPCAVGEEWKNIYPCGLGAYLWKFTSLDVTKFSGRYGKYHVLTLGDAIEPLKEKAREVGANGIIVDQPQPVKSGIISTGI
jgi:hypothetical protein